MHSCATGPTLPPDGTEQSCVRKRTPLSYAPLPDEQSFLPLQNIRDILIESDRCASVRASGIPHTEPLRYKTTCLLVCKISLSFRFRISLSDMTNYKSAFGKVCRIKNRQTFKSMPILNSAYHAVKYAELRIGILLKICRFVIRHITTWYGMPN